MKTEFDKLDIKKPVNIPTSLNNSKTKEDELDVGKLKPVHVELKKFSDVLDNEVVKNTKFNALKTKINHLEKKIPHTTTLIHINQCNIDKKIYWKKLETGKTITDSGGFVTTTFLNTKFGETENIIPDTSGLVTTSVFITKNSKVESKILGHAKYITTHEFNKLTEKNFAGRLKQANLVNKTDFNKKLTSFNKRINSNKTKHVEVQRKLKSVIAKDYNFFLGTIYFSSNDGFQNTFVYQPALDTLELKKDKRNDYVLSSKSKGIYNSKLELLYTAFLYSIKHSWYKTGIKFDKDPLAVEENNYLTKIV